MAQNVGLMTQAFTARESAFLTHSFARARTTHARTGGRRHGFRWRLLGERPDEKGRAEGSECSGGDRDSGGDGWARELRAEGAGDEVRRRREATQQREHAE